MSQPVTKSLQNISCRTKDEDSKVTQFSEWEKGLMKVLRVL